MAAYLGYMDAELIRNQELDPNYKAKARNGTSALWESGIKGTLPSTLDGEVPLSWKIRYWQNLTISSSDRSPTLDNDLRSIRNQAARLNDEEALKLLRDETLILSLIHI